MGRMMTPRDLEIAPGELSDIDKFDYYHAMLGSLLKMMLQPETKTLRDIVWLAKVEAGRVLDEARSKTGADGSQRNPLPVHDEELVRRHA